MGLCKVRDRPLSDCSILKGRSVGMQTRTLTLVFILEESFDGPHDGFGGLVVPEFAGFKPGRSRWIFRASKKSSACLPSEGK
jgi:hypothetical protein